MSIKSIKLAVLAIIPCLFFALSATWRTSMGPTHLWQYDSDYVYLFNGLNVATGRLPDFLIHPGLPDQWITGFVLRLTHPLASRDQLADIVIRNADALVSDFSRMISGAYAITLAVSGIALFLIFEDFTLALIFALMPFLSRWLFVLCTLLTPEGYLVSVATGIGAIALILTFRPNPRREKLLYPALGVLLGLALTLKITIIPLALTTFLLVGALDILHKKHFLLLRNFTAAFLTTAFLVTAPEFKNWRDLIWAPLNLARARSANEGIAPLMVRVKMLLGFDPFLRDATIALIVALVFLLLKRSDKDKRPLLLFGLYALTAIAGGFLLVLHIPEPHYLAPYYVMCCFTAAAAYLTLIKTLPARWIGWARVFCLLLVFYAVFYAVNIRRPSYISVLRDNFDNLKNNQRVEEWAKRGDCEVIRNEGQRNQRTALVFGDWYAGQYYKVAIENFCSDWVMDSGWSQDKKGILRRGEPAALPNDRCYYVIGTAISDSDPRLAKFAIAKVFETAWYFNERRFVYRLTPK